MKPDNVAVEAGQAVYTKNVLSLYDVLVLGISNRFIWKCPSKLIEALYNQHVSDNHLDVGVGTGYFLDRCQLPTNSPRIGLMDLNSNTLEFSSKRISRYRPEKYIQNILEPISSDIPKFDSIGVNYLLHCLPGAMVEKAVVFDHLKSVMNSGATIFGATILQGDVPRSWLAVRLMGIYNKKGIFSNLKDDLETLEKTLDERFENVSIRVSGCVALFSARVE